MGRPAKYIKLNSDKSNMYDVILSYMPAVKRAINLVGIRETEDLIETCLLEIIEALNSLSVDSLQYQTNYVLHRIPFAIYSYITKMFAFSGFPVPTKGNLIENLNCILESIDLNYAGGIFYVYENNPASGYMLLKSDNYQDEVDIGYLEERDVEDKVLKDMEIADLMACLDYLPLKEKDIIIKVYGLFGEKSYTYQEIANFYGVTKGAIEGYVQRIIPKLRRIYISKNRGCSR